jgi:hypothetical protein
MCPKGPVTSPGFSFIRPLFPTTNPYPIGAGLWAYVARGTCGGRIATNR